MCVEVPIVGKHFVTVVDKGDAALVLRFKWYVLPGRHTSYAMATDSTGPKPKTILLHRLILGVARGTLVDHINGDGLDNRRANLRLCGYEENGKNRAHLAVHNKSGVTGVHWSAAMQKWAATVARNKRHLHLGFFTSLEEAAAVRRAAELQYYGEFAPNKH